MIYGHNNNQEKLNVTEEQKEQVEIQEGLPAVSEIAEQLEAVDIPSEKVSETKEKAKDKKGSQVSRAQKASQAKKIKDELLKNPPAEKVMKKQVNKAISKEIKALERQQRLIINNPINRDFHKLNQVIQKLRELKHILADLAQITYDMLKNLWLRFVHDIY